MTGEKEREERIIIVEERWCTSLSGSVDIVWPEAGPSESISNGLVDSKGFDGDNGVMAGVELTTGCIKTTS